MIRPLVLAALSVVTLSLVAQAQTNSPTSSQVVTRHNEERTAVDEESNRNIPSRQSRAEARRLYKQGVKYGRAGLFQQAAELFERTLALDPDYEDAYYSLGHAYLDLGEWDKSIEALRTFLMSKPNDTHAKKMLAHAEDSKKTSPISESPQAELQRAKVRARLASVSSPAAAAATSDEPDPTTIYKIGSGDVLDVRVNGVTPGSTLFTISPTGLLDHPSLTEPLPVTGLTVEEVTARFVERMKRPAVQDPKLSIGVDDYASHRILVSGLAKESGTKILRREAIPLYVVVADAQPLQEASRLTLVRNNSEQNISLLDTDRLKLLVFPGDVITFLPELDQFFYMTGEIVSPGEKKYRQGLTLTQALIVAGGVTDKAKEARVTRDRGDGFLAVTRYKLKDIHSGKLRDPSIQPGDRITIVK